MKRKIKTAVVFAGGQGSRLSEMTDVVPKPMVELCGTPILIRLLKKLNKEGFNKFYILGGEKIDYIYNYFITNSSITGSLVFNKNSETQGLVFKNELEFLNDCELNVLDTGRYSGTAERLKQLENLIKEPFLVTYGDTLSDVPTIEIENLLFKDNDSILSLCAVPYKERFGIMNVTDDSENIITRFKEKSTSSHEFVNGGFICVKPDVFNFIDEEDFDFSRDVLEKKFSIGQMRAYIHKGWWQPIDTLRDLREAEKYIIEE